MLKVKVTKSTRGLGKGIAQNIVFKTGEGFVTAAYSAISVDTREYLVERLARVWNMTCHLPDDVLDVLEAHLTKLALDGGDSAASEQLPAPEVLSTLQGESTPAHRK